MAFVTPSSLTTRFSLSSTSSSLCSRPTQCIRSTTRFIQRVQTPSMHGPGAGHGHPSTAEVTSTDENGRRRRPGEQKGFVEEMRFVAMRLHTRDQAPKEGKQEESALPIDAWYPHKQDFMQFLIDSNHVYTYFETELVKSEESTPMFSRFDNTGLERLQSLNKDIDYLNIEFDVKITDPTPAATKYVSYLKKLVIDKPESVLCHWYNYYFAHSAGGRMIGRLMQDRLFEGRKFAFYEWDSDVKEILNKVRTIIDDVAKDWPNDVKEECLKETSLAFGFSGTVLQNLAKAPQ